MKNSHSLLFFLAIFSISTSFSQVNLLNGPEGIAYDSDSKSYFITNATDGKVIRIDSLGGHSTLFEGLSVPMGIHLVGDFLLVSSNDPSTISCIHASSGELLGTIIITETESMAHMDYDPRTQSLYVISQQGHAIKVDVPTLTYEVFVPAGGGLPVSSQTCCVDTTANCLFVFSWPVAFVRMVNLDNPSIVQSLVNPQWGQYIDCVRGPDGSIYTSSWQGNLIHKFSPGCTALPDVYATGFNKPAGLVFNPEENLIAVCNFESNSIDFIPLNTTGLMPFPAEIKSPFELFPNPVRSALHIQCLTTEIKMRELRVFNSSGTLIYEKNHGMNASAGHIEILDCTGYPAGIYFLEIIHGGKTYLQKFIKQE